MIKECITHIEFNKLHNSISNYLKLQLTLIVFANLICRIQIPHLEMTVLQIFEQKLLQDKKML